MKNPFASFFKLPLHWQILTGMFFGLIYGILASTFHWSAFTDDWIAPFGTIFVNLLKLIAVPLVLGSLITGVASLSDLKKLSRIGGKTIAIYIATTAFAVIIGLILCNMVKPGQYLSPEMRDSLQTSFQGSITEQTDMAAQAKERGPLLPVVEMIPDNIVSAASNNRNMLQVVFFAIFIGIAIVQVGEEKCRSFLGFWSGLNDVTIKSVDNIMLLAPIGVFALISKTITSMVKDDPTQLWTLLQALGSYCIVVLLGLILHMALVYFPMLRSFTPIKLKQFLGAIGPVQLLAFSTSSSAATLPLTMERCEQELGVSEEVSSFVLPLGATINMDGTALYQAVATVFIAQAIGMNLSMGDQMTIVVTSVLASIGTAAVPGAGIIMLVVILESVNVPAQGIALIIGVDRMLDMCRTVVNVTGDTVVATMIAASENELKPVHSHG
jgi:proton glutamate symport protein